MDIFWSTGRIQSGTLIGSTRLSPTRPHFHQALVKRTDTGVCWAFILSRPTFFLAVLHCRALALFSDDGISSPCLSSTFIKSEPFPSAEPGVQLLLTRKHKRVAVSLPIELDAFASLLGFLFVWEGGRERATFIRRRPFWWCFILVLPFPMGQGTCIYSTGTRAI